MTITPIRLHAERFNGGQSPETSYNIESAMVVDGKTVNFKFDVRADLWGDETDPETGDRSAVGVVEVSMVIAFEVSGRLPAAAVMEHLGRTDAPMMVYPFLRENVSSLAAKVGVLGVNLPMLTRSELIDGIDG